MGYKTIADLKMYNDEVRNDKILCKALTNKDEFFEVQIRKENKMVNDQDYAEPYGDRPNLSNQAINFQFLQTAKKMNV